MNYDLAPRSTRNGFVDCGGRRAAAGRQVWISLSRDVLPLSQILEQFVEVVAIPQFQVVEQIQEQIVEP